MVSTTSKLGRQGEAASAAKALLDTKVTVVRKGTAPRAKWAVKGPASPSSDAFKEIRKFSGKPYARSLAFKKALRALELATEAGTPSRLVLDVDAAGKTLIGLEILEPQIMEVEEPGEPDAELQAALKAARERGRASAAEILAQDDMLSADDFAKMLGTTRATVNTKRQRNELLALDGAKRGFRFPVWQVDGNGKPYAELPRLLEMLGDPWAVYRFLIQPQSELDGLSAREAFERGLGKDVLAAAESIGRDFR